MHPTRKSTLTLLVAAALLIAISGIGQDEHGYWTSAPSWIGDIGWYGAMICLLLLLVSGLYTVVSRIRHHDRHLAH